MVVQDIKNYSNAIYEIIQLMETDLTKCQVLEIIDTKNFHIPKKLIKLILHELRCKDKNESINFLQFLHFQLEKLSKLPEENVKNFYYSNSVVPLPEKILAQIMLDILRGDSNKVVQFGKNHTLNIYERYDSNPTFAVKTYSIFGKKSKLIVKDVNLWKKFIEDYNNTMNTMEISDTTPQHWINVAETWHKTYETQTNLKLLSVNLSGSVIVTLDQNSPTMYNFIQGNWSKDENFYNLNPPDSLWSRLALSYEGLHQIVCGNTGFCVSNTEEHLWIKHADGIVFDSCGVSGNGKYMIAATTGAENIYVSSDYGKTFQIKEGDRKSAYSNFALSEDGKIQIAGRFSGLDVSYDYGNTWINLVSNKFVPSVCINSDGSHLTFNADGSLYVSNLENEVFTEPRLVLLDYGTFDKISMDLTGQYQIAHKDDGSYITSSDFGETWYYHEDKFNNVVISGSGQISIAVDNSIYTSVSTPVNMNWELLFDTGLNLKLAETNKIGGVITTDGKTIYYCDDKKYQFIEDTYFSQNNEITSIAADNLISVATTNGAYLKKDDVWQKVLDGSFNSTAMNSSYILFARSEGTELLLSKDYGVTFNSTFRKTYQDNFYDLAISQSGQIQVASSEKYTSVSYDYGINWYEYGWKPIGAQVVALSKNGRYLTLGFGNTLAISELGDNGFFQTPYVVKEVNGKFINIAMNNSGMRQVVVYETETGKRYLVSVDRGHTWELSTDEQFNNVIINKTGNSLLAFNNSIYVKNNSELITEKILGIEVEQAISNVESIIIAGIEEIISKTDDIENFILKLITMYRIIIKIFIVVSE